MAFLCISDFVRFEPFHSNICNHGRHDFNIPSCSVDREFIVCAFAPFNAGYDSGVACTSLIDLLNVLGNFFDGVGTACFVVKLAIVDSGVEVSANENAEGFVIFQAIVSVSTNDDAILAFGSDLFQNALFFLQKVLLCDFCGVHLVKGVVEFERNGLPKVAIDHIRNKFFFKFLIFCDSGNNFAVVISKTELFSEELAEFTSAASEFTADGDNLHKGTPF